jgi:hypothetical protein
MVKNVACRKEKSFAVVREGWESGVIHSEWSKEDSQISQKEVGNGNEIEGKERKAERLGCGVEIDGWSRGGKEINKRVQRK